MKIDKTTKRHFWAGFFFAALLSLFFGYIIGAAAVVIITALQGFLAVTLADAPGTATIKEFATVTAGVLVAVAGSVAASYVWAIVLGT